MHDPLHILYQDEWLIAVDKPAGHLVHPADHPKEDDLVTMKILRDQIGALVYNIHRIDRPTSGVLLFGIDRDAARSLHRALERHEVKKTYWAIIQGTPSTRTWECQQPLKKTEDSPEQNAHTSFRILETNNHLTLLEATPHTGRFHQIRKHLLHAQMPIVGDFRYAGIEHSSALGKELGTGTRMLLQSHSISFTHPINHTQTHITAPADPTFNHCFPSLAKNQSH